MIDNERKLQLYYRFVAVNDPVTQSNKGAKIIGAEAPHLHKYECKGLLDGDNMLFVSLPHLSVNVSVVLFSIADGLE